MRNHDSTITLFTVTTTYLTHAVTFNDPLPLSSRLFYITVCPFPLHSIMVASVIFTFIMIGKNNKNNNLINHTISITNSQFNIFM